MGLLQTALLVQGLQRALHLGGAVIVPVDGGNQVCECVRRPVPNQFNGAASPLEEGNRFVLLYIRHVVLSSHCETKRPSGRPEGAIVASRLGRLNDRGQGVWSTV